MKINHDLAARSKLVHKSEAESVDSLAVDQKNKIDAEGLGDKSYSVEVSSQSLDRNKLHASILDQLKNIPEVREDKVSSLKEKIASGSYQIDSESILNNFLKEEALDSMALSLLTRKNS